MNRPYAESADQNKQFIAEVLQNIFVTSGSVLEIGAGTGQHARYFASLFPHLRWTPSEVPQYMTMLSQGVLDTGISNLADPVLLDVDLVDSSKPNSIAAQYDYFFTANTLHIMSWQSCINCISLASRLLAEGGVMASYGPFNVDGQFTSDSNARFEQWLKQRDPVSGIRDIGDLRREALAEKLDIDDIIEMPANNKILIWRKV